MSQKKCSMKEQQKMPPDGLLMAGEANWAKARWKGDLDEAV